MRYELKYNPLVLSFDDCIGIIRGHPGSFRSLHPDRQVNNIYLDSPDLDCFNDNVSGVSRRKKYRIRWYGDDFDSIHKPQLELKWKENQLGGKVTSRMSNFSMMDQRQVVQSMAKQGLIPPHYGAVSTNSYTRSYFQSMDGCFRVTIDHNLVFGNFFSGPGSPSTRCDRIIVELKYDQGLDDEAERIRQFLPFQRTRFSKYVHGLLTVLGV